MAEAPPTEVRRVEILAMLSLATDLGMGPRGEHHGTGASGNRTVLRRLQRTGPLATPDGEVPPTGRRLTFDAVTVASVRGQAIRSWHGYYDQMAIAAQLGLMGGA